jgi:hypothetical protein
MSENSEPVAVEPKTIAPLSHRRILWTMGIIVLSGASVCAALVSGRFGLGFLIGGITAFLNYYWLKISLKRIFDNAIASAASGERPRFSATGYFLRYLGIGALLYLVYLSEAVPFIAVLLGLCVFALAIVIEGLLRILSGISKREEF